MNGTHILYTDILSSLTSKFVVDNSHRFMWSEMVATFINRVMKWKHWIYSIVCISTLYYKDIVFLTTQKFTMVKPKFPKYVTNTELTRCLSQGILLLNWNPLNYLGLYFAIGWTCGQYITPHETIRTYMCIIDGKHPELSRLHISYLELL